MGKIVLLGDSLTASANVTLEDRWAYKVGISAGYAPADIINAGVSGNRSDQMLARLQTDVLSLCPDVMVLMLTVNDKTNAITLAAHETNYRSMIGQAQAQGIKAVVMSPPIYTQGLDQWKPWVEKGEQIAGDMGCHYVDCWREYAYATWYEPGGVNAWYAKYYVDYVHQTEAGNALIFSITQRASHAGAFVKAAPAAPPAGDCPACQPATELQLAGEDLLLHGATAARLERVKAALPA